MKRLTPIFLLTLSFLLTFCKSNTTDSKQISATYVDATVYAGSTDYYFEDKKGETIQFRVSNFEEDPQLRLPDNLLDPNVEEGPPGGNPALIGKAFNLIYDEKDKLIEVKYMGK